MKVAVFQRRRHSKLRHCFRYRNRDKRTPRCDNWYRPRHHTQRHAQEQRGFPGDKM